MKRPRLPRLRRVVQVLLLLLFAAVVVGDTWDRDPLLPGDTFLRLDPLLSLQASIAGRTLVPALGTGLLVLGLALLLGRFFCGWVCPFGTLIEMGEDVVHGRKRPRAASEPSQLRGVKFAVLAAVLGAALLGTGLAWLVDPLVWATRLVGLAAWPLAVASGEVALRGGRPLFEAAGWMGLARADLPAAGLGVAGVAAVLVFGAAVALGRLQRRFWCRVLCPLGALLALAARWSPLRRLVEAGRCDHSLRCARTCPTGAIGSDPTVTDAGECILCLECLPACRPGATRFAFGMPGHPAPTDLSRRAALGAIGTGAAVGAWLALEPRQALAREQVLRPPGAVPEPDFLATCVRCGACVAACPTRCLQPALLEGGPAGLLAPIPMMRLAPCDPNCTACGEVCPTGSLRRLDRWEKPHARIGNAILDRTRCVAWAADRACLVCDENCPWGAIHWQETAGGGRGPVVDAIRCNGCGQCEAACPVEGVSAIRVEPGGKIRLAPGDGSFARAAAERGLVAEARAEGEW